MTGSTPRPATTEAGAAPTAPRPGGETAKQPDRELRLALAMRGGVSLAVWIGGAVREVDQLRRDVSLGGTDGGPDLGNALGRLAAGTGVSSVVVDVMSGASAGGLNAVLYGTALTAGTPVAELRRIWQDVADLEQLQHSVRAAPALSILNGDYFHGRLREAVMSLLPPSDPPGQRSPGVDRLDVLLSVTSIVPVATTTAIDPSLPEVERRVDALVRLQHRASGDGRFSSDFVAEEGQEPRTLHVERLATAGRATAAFPVAFTPVEVPRSSDLYDRVYAEPKLPDPLYLFDGGVVDNMPVGKAARAIETAPADGPTSRLLLYFFPSPGGVGSDDGPGRDQFARHLETDGAGPIDVARSGLHALQGKSLAADLRGIQEHNDSVRRQLAERQRLLREAREQQDPPALPPEPAPAPSLESAKVLNPAEVAGLHQDVERLVDVLVHPAVHVDGIVPLPQVTPVLEGTTPMAIAKITCRVRLDLDREPLELDESLPVLSRQSVRPWSAPIRIASLLIEWCRELEAARTEEAIGQCKRRLYAQRDVAFERASRLNQDTIDRVREELPSGPASPVDVGRALVAVRRAQLRGTDDEMVDVRACWNRIVDLATGIAAIVSAGAGGGSQVDQASNPAAKDEPSEGGLSEGGGRARKDPKTIGSVLLRLADPDCDARDFLGWVDAVLLPLHQCAPLGSLATIDYKIISGRAESPLSLHHVWPNGAREECLAERKLFFQTLVPRSQERNTIEPESKLAGNQLHNFAAFLRTSWRTNDWMWGRLDAVPTLADVLLDPAGPKPDLELVKAIVLGRGQEADGGEGPVIASPSPDPAGAEGDPTRAAGSGAPGDGARLCPTDPHPPAADPNATWWRRAIDAEAWWIWSALEGQITKELLQGTEWPATRAAIIWRRQIEILAEERISFPQQDVVDACRPGAIGEVTPPDESPSARSEREGRDLKGVMEAWDGEARALVDEWGRSKSSAIAMRSASVAWRTLFEHSGALRLVRVVFAPLVMWLTGLFVGRRRSVLAIEFVLVGTVLPRTLGWYGRYLVLALVLVVLLGGLALGKRRKREAPLRWCQWPVIAGSYLLAGAAIVGAVRPSLFGAVVPPLLSVQALGTASHQSWVLVPALAMAIATAVSWFWATPAWRIVATVTNGSIVGAWVILASRGSGAPRYLRPIESLYWCLLLVIPMLYVLVTFNIDVFLARPVEAPIPIALQPPAPLVESAPDRQRGQLGDRCAEYRE